MLWSRSCKIYILPVSRPGGERPETNGAWRRVYIYVWCELFRMVRLYMWVDMESLGFLTQLFSAFTCASYFTNLLLQKWQQQGSDTTCGCICKCLHLYKMWPWVVSWYSGVFCFHFCSNTICSVICHSTNCQVMLMQLFEYKCAVLVLLLMFKFDV